MYKIYVLGLCLACATLPAQAKDFLLYVEGQGIGGYSSAAGKAILYSMHPDMEMQKPSLGFDWLQRISGETGDVAALALQARLALGQDAGGDYRGEPQIYNAYLKVKSPWVYVWLGHNRPAFGLSSYFDSHSLLLGTPTTQGFGYDRDWGAGGYHDFSWGNVSASITTGSGMPIRITDHSYLTAVRAAYGVLNQDNFNIGLSVATGSTLDTTGYTVRDSQPRSLRLVGTDATLLVDNLENRVDLLAGQWLQKNTFVFFYRAGLNLGEEARFKMELQPTYWRFGGEHNWQMAACLSANATSDLTARLAYVYDYQTNDHRILTQLYYYLPL